MNPRGWASNLKSEFKRISKLSKFEGVEQVQLLSKISLRPL